MSIKGTCVKLAGPIWTVAASLCFGLESVISPASGKVFA